MRVLFSHMQHGWVSWVTATVLTLAVLLHCRCCGPYDRSRNRGGARHTCRRMDVTDFRNAVESEEAVISTVRPCFRGALRGTVTGVTSRGTGVKRCRSCARGVLARAAPSLSLL